MTEELMTQSFAFRCTFYYTWNIRNCETLEVFVFNDSKIWFERGERIIGNFWFRSRYFWNQVDYRIWKPTSPTSAINFIRELLFMLTGFSIFSKTRSLISRSSKLTIAPSSFPPFARITSFPSASRSKSNSSVSASLTMVPTGTWMITSWPLFPSFRELRRYLRCQRCIFFYILKSRSVWRLVLALIITFPPFPPSPPDGPPLGTYFSRRNVTAPSPPFRS